MYIKLLRSCKLGFLAPALFLLGLQAHVDPGLPRPSAASLPSQQSNTWLLNHYSIISDSDLDGDHQPDVAAGRVDGQSYRVEIQLTTQPQKTTLLTLSSGDLLVQLSARDVDGDNDQDLVASSATALYPLALWLNDGKGHFQQGDLRMGTALITSRNPSGYEGSSSQGNPVCISPDGRLPMDKSNAQLVAAVIENLNGVVAESEKSFLQNLSDKLTARSPPLIFIL
jgi:hypothetical protein